MMTLQTRTMQAPDAERPVRHCVIGAGFQGLPIVKSLLELGEEVLCLDRNDDVGGIWRNGAYDTAHIISSRYTTAFPDFAMPDGYPDFPSRDEMQRYFRSYAETFDLLPHIRLNSDVVSVRPLPEDPSPHAPRWIVRCRDGLVVRALTVAIANGHHTEPVTAQYPGDWSGAMIQSQDYRTPSIFNAKRTLVVGLGNTACDAAVDASLHGASADISVREGTYLFPRTFMGRPLDRFLAAIPLQSEWLERLAGWVIYKCAVGDVARYGLPRPKIRVFARHPVINAELLRRIKLGEIGVRPEIASYNGTTVTFADGTSSDYDQIFWAIGYRITLPMLPEEDDVLKWQNGRPVLFLQLMAPHRRGLFIAGLGQARTGGGPLFELAGKLVARMAAFEAKSDRPLQQAIAGDSRMAFFVRWFGLRLVEPADTVSRSKRHHESGGAQLAAVLDRIGAPKLEARTAKSTVRSDLQLAQTRPASVAA